MGKLDGKRLLVLGTSIGSVDVVQYAKAQGAYVLVTDYLPTEKSAAKQYADATAMVSTLDVQAVCELAKENCVDGIFCGVSEANLQTARQVCEKLGLPTYYTSQQWDAFMKKDSFRRLCQTYHVGVPQTYFAGTREEFDNAWPTGAGIHFPVIVKPVDNGANVGVSVCRDRESFLDAIEYAFSKSDAGRIIIEQFVEGVEVSLTYVVQNGVSKLVSMCSKHTCDAVSGLVSHAYMYPSPSPCLEEYLKDMDNNVRAMIHGQKIDNCSLFFQGIYADHQFYIFEAGLRMQGTASFRITKRMCGESYMEFMVDNALGVQSDYNIEREDVTFGGRKCVIFSMLAKGGVIARIEGFEEASKNSVVVAAEQRYREGDFVTNDGTLKQIVFRFVLQHDDLDTVLDTIRYLQKTVKAYDAEGNGALLECFDPEVLR